MSGAMSGGNSEGGTTLGLVAQDVLASLGPAVWPMVQADQTLRRIFTQSLVDWDYWGTQGDLLVLETYLDAVGGSFSGIRKSALGSRVQSICADQAVRAGHVGGLGATAAGPGYRGRAERRVRGRAGLGHIGPVGAKSVGASGGAGDLRGAV